LWPDEFQNVYTDAEVQAEALSEFDRIITEPRTSEPEVIGGEKGPNPMAEEQKKPMPEEQTVEQKFWKIIPPEYKRKQVEEFLAIAAKTNKVEIREAMASAIANEEGFLRFLGGWMKKISKPVAREEPKNEPAPVDFGPQQPETTQTETPQTQGTTEAENFIPCPEGGYVEQVTCGECKQKKDCESWK
jgi:hypothetical protein